ncbi:MAG: transposase [Quinella sp. 3Q1]|nr:transposase [Quinella sp. 3Q1]MBR3051724.1 transposase [Selenomonadaceae bacterium]MBR6888886.1 transposase [Selenomonadaceae bacterium]
MEATGHYWLPLYAHLELCRQRFFIVDMASDLRLLSALALPLLLSFFPRLAVTLENFLLCPTYAGLYPKSHQSGESKSDGHMSKRGSPYLRRAV